MLPYAELLDRQGRALSVALISAEESPSWTPGSSLAFSSKPSCFPSMTGLQTRLVSEGQ